jgi:hypothetical protein
LIPRGFRVVGLKGNADASLIQRPCSRAITLIFIGCFREVLVLAEDNSNIVGVSMGQADDIKSNANIDTFLLPDEKGMLPTSRQFHRLIAVA